MADAVSSVRVLGVRIANRALDGNSLPGLVATFDVQVPGLLLLACQIYRTRSGEMMISPPRSDRHDGVASGVRFNDDALRVAITAAACDMARSFGASVDPIEPASA